jgi:hypothetical protein
VFRKSYAVEIAANERGCIPNLKELFPIMVAACKSFIGRNTKKKALVYLQEEEVMRYG